jgi:uncharacterized delta-60 repeat protein
VPGGIDSTFGIDGFAYLDEPGNEGRNPPIPTLAYSKDGDFIYALMSITYLDQVICRLHGATGEIDASFGDMDGHKGYVRLPYSPEPYFLSWNHIVVADSSNVIVLGQAQDSWGSIVAPVACRLLDDGTVDTSFGEDGLGVYLIPAPALRHIVRRAATPRAPMGQKNEAGMLAALSTGDDQASQLADGSLLFLANLYDGNSTYLVKIDRNGQLDPSFAGTGYLPVGNIGQAIFAFNIGNTRDGKILVAGRIGPGTALVMRFDSRGYLDITFGIGGRVEIADPEWNCSCRGVSVAADGKIIILVALSREDFPFTHHAAGLLRVDRDGRRDASFNNGQLAVVDLAPYSFMAYQLVVDEGTRPLIGGNRREIQSGRLMLHPTLARFLGDGRLDHTFGVNGITGAISPDEEEASFVGMAIQGTSKILTLGTGRPYYIARVHG